MDCKNCGYSNNVEDKFCANCGQKNLENLSLKVLLGELANAYLSWDSKLFRTLGPLFTKPGFVSLKYIDGKRKSYVAPLRMYIFCSVLFFLTLSFFGGQNNEDSMFQIQMGEEIEAYSKDELILMIENDELEQIPSVANVENDFWRHMTKQSIRINVESGSFMAYLRNNISFMFFLFIPVFGLVLKLFFRKKDMYYIEHIIYGLYFHSFIFLIQLLSFVGMKLTANGLPLLIGYLGIVVYLVFGLKRFYNIPYSVSVLKTIFITLVYLLLFLAFAAVTIGWTVYLY
ncbi:DUF3667 domain-containing protein [Paracrocinitomix mangrovi]|uniref:DUF3667 domain-containing protein n=1 Tax=Paracrocinitomix mangrovi TaxID=2862509 RepID=UPI001C8DA858|nr:DUF3667 domain-containing protein [Paracrocinitomix mangrovi]UKN00954.1 DUF3667 domain-containing protein [Paracrocinitomix mangrovi]